MRLKFISTRLLLLSLITLILYFLGFPLSAHMRHKIRKIITKAEITFSKLRGYEPRLISISGSTGVPGAHVQALDSRSGWATFCDIEGRFTLADVLWYPGATYDLVVSTDDDKGNIVEVRAPSSFPASGVLDAGTLSLNSLDEVDLSDLPGINSFSNQYFDLANRDYYRSIFDEITRAKNTDEEKIDAINDYMATRLNYNETRLNHVPAGGRIRLAAAGILAGSNVTYHIRKPGSDQDELTFSSRGGGNSNCVLDEEESPPINLALGLYEVFVDLHDGNVLDPSRDGPAFISNRVLGIKLEVR